MKKIFAVLMILVTIATMFTGCKKEPDMKLFCDWLSDSGFMAGLGKTGFSNHISQYYRDGKPLQQKGEYYNVTGGEGYTVGTEAWKWTHETSENGSKVHNHFATNANLDGLSLPGGVRIGDSWDFCIDKLGLKDKKTDTKGVEVGKGTCDLTIDDSMITFKEYYDWYNDSGKIVKVTRILIFKFINHKLTEFSVTVTEKG